MKPEASQQRITALEAEVKSLQNRLLAQNGLEQAKSKPDSVENKFIDLMMLALLKCENDEQITQFLLAYHKHIGIPLTYARTQPPTAESIAALFSDLNKTLITDTPEKHHYSEEQIQEMKNLVQSTSQTMTATKLFYALNQRVYKVFFDGKMQDVAVLTILGPQGPGKSEEDVKISLTNGILKTLRDNAAALKSAIQSESKTKAELTKEVSDQAGIIARLEAELATAKVEIEALKAELQALKKEHQSEITPLNTELGAANGINAELLVKIGALEAAAKEFEASKRPLQTKIEELESSGAENNAESQKLKAELKSLKNKFLGVYNSAIQSTATEYTDGMLEAVTAQLDTLRIEAEDSRTLAEGLQTEIATLTEAHSSAIAAKEAEITALKSQLDTSKQELATSKDTLTELQAANSELESQLKTLQAELATLRASQGAAEEMNAAVSAALRAALGDDTTGDLATGIAALASAKNTATTSLSEREVKLAELQAKNAALESEIARLKETHLTALTNLQAQLAASGASLTESEAEIEALKAAQAAEILKLNGQITTLTEQLAASDTAQKEASARAAEAEAELASLKAALTASQAAQALSDQELAEVSKALNNPTDLADAIEQLKSKAATADARATAAAETSTAFEGQLAALQAQVTALEAENAALKLAETTATAQAASSTEESATLRQELAARQAASTAQAEGLADALRALTISIEGMSQRDRADNGALLAATEALINIVRTMQPPLESDEEFQTTLHELSTIPSVEEQERTSPQSEDDSTTQELIDQLDAIRSSAATPLPTDRTLPTTLRDGPTVGSTASSTPSSKLSDSTSPEQEIQTIRWDEFQKETYRHATAQFTEGEKLNHGYIQIDSSQEAQGKYHLSLAPSYEVLKPNGHGTYPRNSFDFDLYINEHSAELVKHPDSRGRLLSADPNIWMTESLLAAAHIRQIFSQVSSFTNPSDYECPIRFSTATKFGSPEDLMEAYLRQSNALIVMGLEPTIDPMNLNDHLIDCSHIDTASFLRDFVKQLEENAGDRQQLATAIGATTIDQTIIDSTIANITNLAKRHELGATGPGMLHQLRSKTGAAGLPSSPPPASPPPKRRGSWP